MSHHGGPTNSVEDMSVALDTGVPWINRVQILSGGQELENIDSHNRLYAIMQSIQGNPEQAGEWSLTQKEHFPATGTTAASVATAPAVTTANAAAGTAIGDFGAAPNAATDAAAVTTGFADFTNAAGVLDEVKAIASETVNRVLTRVDTRLGQVETALGAIATATDTRTADQANFGKFKFSATDSDKNGRLAGAQRPGESGGKFTYNFNVISAILSQPKYFPLIFTNLGLDIYLYLEDAVNVGVYHNLTRNTASGNKFSYQITDVRYHCHMVDVDRSFYDRMRQSMMASGGVLQLSGTTYKHYQDNFSNKTPTHNLQISTRVKSLNNLYVRPQREVFNNKGDRFCISTGEGCGILDYKFRIGSMQYPQQAIKVSASNKGESYNELRKCVGVLGNYMHNSWINQLTYAIGPLPADQIAATFDDNADSAGAADNGNGANAKSGANKSFFVAAYGFEGFAKTAAESGINVSDRALPVVCEITRGVMTTDGTAEADTRIRYDIFAETDMIIYLTADGQMSTRI